MNVFILIAHPSLDENTNGVIFP